MSTLRLLQLSDVHLDCAFSGVADQVVRDRLRGEQRDCFRAALAPARKAEVDAVLIPGDLFEHDRVSLDTIKFIQRELQAVVPIPVFIAPGNHDPCIRSSYYTSLDWPENVHVFTLPVFRPVEICDGRATVFGIANSGVEDSRPALEMFTASGSGCKIGVFHGSCIDAIPADFADIRCLPFTSNDLARAGFDYSAIGHYHSFSQLGTLEQPIACYSGCLSCCGFDESGEKYSLIVEISDSEVTLQKVLTKCRSFETVMLDIGKVETSEQILDAIRDVAIAQNLSESVVRVNLKGEVEPGVDLKLSEMRERASESFFHLTIDASGISTAYDYEFLARQNSVAGELVCEVRRRLENIPEGSPEKTRIEKALIYALDALLGKEVRAE